MKTIHGNVYSPNIRHVPSQMIVVAIAREYVGKGLRNATGRVGSKKIDKQLRRAGWDIVPRDEYVPYTTSAVKEALMKGNKESDYLLFVDNKAIAVVLSGVHESRISD